MQREAKTNDKEQNISLTPKIERILLSCGSQEQ